MTAIRIAMWSGPRHISTAMMRAFENREDTVVVDEPLYAHYLAKTGLDHPGRDRIIASQPTDWQSVVEAITGPIPDDKPVYYQKHMTHHLLPEIDRGWLAKATNCFLIRDPDEVLSSYWKKRAAVDSLDDLGYPQQAEIFQFVVDRTGEIPPIIESNDLLMDPPGMLRALCDRVRIPFQATMLSWPAGPRNSDGAWAEHWYDAVIRSTGFGPYREPVVDIPDHLRPLAEKSRPFFDLLYDNRLTAD